MKKKGKERPTEISLDLSSKKESYQTQALLSELRHVVDKYGLSADQIQKIFGERGVMLFEEEPYSVPVSAFNNGILSALETIVKFLVEIHDLALRDIAKLLNRSNKTIWSTYNKTKKKMPQPFELSECKIAIPLSIFKDRKLSVLEAIIWHLCSRDLKVAKIALLLGRSERTVWTTYYNLKKKGVSR